MTAMKRSYHRYDSESVKYEMIIDLIMELLGKILELVWD